MLVNTIVAACVALALAALAALSTSASAQTLYKCSSGGKTSYGDQPCADGRSVELAVPAAPQQAPQDAARLVREQHSLEKLEQRRQKEDDAADSEQRRVDRGAAAQHKKCAKLQLDGKWASEDARAAPEKSAAAALTKARRAAEKLALECPA